MSTSPRRPHLLILTPTHARLADNGHQATGRDAARTLYMRPADRVSARRNGHLTKRSQTEVRSSRTWTYGAHRQVCTGNGRGGSTVKPRGSPTREKIGNREKKSERSTKRSLGGFVSVNCARGPPRPRAASAVDRRNEANPRSGQAGLGLTARSDKLVQVSVRPARRRPACRPPTPPRVPPRRESAGRGRAGKSPSPPTAGSRTPAASRVPSDRSATPDP